MGLTWVEAVIKNPNTDRHATAKALVNTAATLTVLPRRIAERLQLPVIGRKGTAKGAAEFDGMRRCRGGHGQGGLHPHARIKRLRHRAGWCNNAQTKFRSRPSRGEAEGSRDVSTLSADEPACAGGRRKTTSNAHSKSVATLSGEAPG